MTIPLLALRQGIRPRALVPQRRRVVRLVRAGRDSAVVSGHPQGASEYDGRPVALGRLGAVLAGYVGAWVGILAGRRLGSVA